MNEKSAAELEREADIARANIVDTADSIRNKMTPGQLIDEFASLFAGGNGSQMLDNLRAQVRGNPLPLTLVGAGLAWLMLGHGASAISANNWNSEPSPNRAPSGSQLPGEPGHGTGLDTKLSEAVSSMTSAAGAAASAAASGASDRLTSMTGQVSSKAGDMAARATRSAQDWLQHEPLALAAAGLALGTAIGAMLPHSALEDEQFGSYRDRLRDSAAGALEEGLDQAKQVVADAYDTVKDEADLQRSNENTLVGQVGELVRATTDETERAIRDRLSDSEPSKDVPDHG
ncbi:hypothetical protein LB533_13665 [Mesorhizobium sp. BR1-1-13]|uniref:hypothetical protein n=1 Tax=Mesorhizobium sp. BR1-1-13 TaxID=2876656 RepID=UPI001CD15ACD|nr:hypothetical protein [Mesorhizobium sp. BR1-1-13]MBZ9942151.1 hypothetical protein [Mesorhizobium sp. BR1-1-13]